MKSPKLNQQKTLFLGFALAMVLATKLFAQQEAVSLRMDVDKRQVEVGDSLTLKVESKQIGSGNVSVMGEPEIPTPENFEIRGQSSFTSITMLNQNTVATTTTEKHLVAT